MAVVDRGETGLFIDIVGKLGRPNELGCMWCGWSHLGDSEALAGYFQHRPRVAGQMLVQMRHYWPTNNQHSVQQVWRWVFGDAVAAWQSLTDEQKLFWNKRKYPRRMSGYNRFLRDYLQTHQ